LSISQVYFPDATEFQTIQLLLFYIVIDCY